MDECEESMNWPLVELTWENEEVLEFLSPLEQATSSSVNLSYPAGDVQIEKKEEEIEEHDDFEVTAAALAAVELKCKGTTTEANGTIHDCGVSSNLGDKSEDFKVVDTEESRNCVSNDGDDGLRNESWSDSLSNEVFGREKRENDLYVDMNNARRPVLLPRKMEKVEIAITTKSNKFEWEDNKRFDKIGTLQVPKSEAAFIASDAPCSDECIESSYGKANSNLKALDGECLSSEDYELTSSDEFTGSDENSEFEIEDVADLDEDVNECFGEVLREARNKAEAAKLELRRRLKSELAEQHDALDAQTRGKLRSRREAAVSRHNKNEYATQLEIALRKIIMENCAFRRARRPRRRRRVSHRSHAHASSF